MAPMPTPTAMLKGSRDEMISILLCNWLNDFLTFCVGVIVSSQQQALTDEEQTEELKNYHHYYVSEMNLLPKVSNRHED